MDPGFVCGATIRKHVPFCDNVIKSDLAPFLDYASLGELVGLGFDAKEMSSPRFVEQYVEPILLQNLHKLLILHRLQPKPFCDLMI